MKLSYSKTLLFALLPLTGSSLSAAESLAPSNAVEADHAYETVSHTDDKKDGYLLINTPSVFGGSDVHDEDEESFIGEHAREGYSKEDFESKLHPLGFETYQSIYTYGFWGDKAWRLGIKFPMLLLNISKIFFIVLPFYYLITLPFTFLMMYIDYSTNNKVGSGINFIAHKK